jgi:hypothetical protein
MLTNISQGDYLKMVMTAIYKTIVTKNQRYNTANLSVGGIGAFETPQLVNTFYDLLNGEKLTPFDLTESLDEPYMQLRGKLANSCVTSADTYEANWFWIRDFTGPNHLLTDRAAIIDGVPLAPGQVRYETNFTGPAVGADIYQWLITTRRVVLTDTGFQYVAVLS